MEPARGRTLLVASTKYDGSLHYEYEAKLIGREDSMLRLLVEAGSPYRGHNGGGRARERYTALFWTDRDYNVYHNHRPVGRRRIASYANVALPAEIDGDTVRWVDLDLDVILTADGEVVLDDADEFEQHRREFAYPDALVERATAARDELLRAARTGVFPFDRAEHVGG